MRVLVACEESQAVCTAFRELGHEAYSCDIIPCSGGHPEWHIKGDALEVINPIDGVDFITMDSQIHHIEKWDMIIAHPPCTYLTITSNRWFNESGTAKKQSSGTGTGKTQSDFSWHLQTRIATELLLKIRSA